MMKFLIISLRIMMYSVISADRKIIKIHYFSYIDIVLLQSCILMLSLETETVRQEWRNVYSSLIDVK